MSHLTHSVDTPPIASNSTTQILIIGAGFGGLAAALELAKSSQYSNSLIEVSIIDKNNYQLFTPDLYEIASAAHEIHNEEELKNAVCLDVKLALAQQKIRFIQATVQDIQTKKQTVITDNGEYTYDYLLIALGSEPFYFGIPGMQEHALPFKWIQHASQIREDVQTSVQENKNPHIVVCGGGPAGVELAAELMHAYKKELANHSFSLSLVEGRDSLLSMIGKRSQRIAARALEKLGVSVRTGFLIAKAEERNGKKVITNDKGEEIEADVLIWAGGVTATSVLKQSDLELTQRGQIAVQTTLQTKQDERVFAVGDVIECEIAPKEYCPQTAHEAIQQGPVAAKNIIAHMNDTQLQQHKKIMSGLIITLGGKKGLVELSNGIVLSGFIGWVTRKAIDFRHFRSVLPFMQACSIWYKGLKTMTKND